VTSSYDKTIQLWDIDRPAGRWALAGHTEIVTSVPFSPDGTRIVTGSRDKTIWVWDHGCSDETANCIVIGSWDNTVWLWDAATGQPLSELREHSDAIRSVTFSADGARIITSSWGSTVRLWDAVVDQPSHQRAESHPTIFLDEYPIYPTEVTTAMPPSTQSVHLIRFSSNSTHALYNTAELMMGTFYNDYSSTVSTPFVLKHDNGWVVGLTADSCSGYYPLLDTHFIALRLHSLGRNKKRCGGCTTSPIRT
jgi:WD40 repeat protein